MMIHIYKYDCIIFKHINNDVGVDVRAAGVPEGVALRLTYLWI
jgi:hypothetical protein